MDEDVHEDDGAAVESVPEEAIVTVAEGGPLYVRGDVTVTDGDGTVLVSDTRVALCRCGASGNRPLCDGSHVATGFEADGTVGEVYEESDALPDVDGLRVTMTPNGPLHLEGTFEMTGASDASTHRGDDAWLCRCGDSEYRPFCDGTHKRGELRSGDE